MNYYFDTEFIETPWCLSLVSIGIVAEDGREFYAVSSEAQTWSASEWVKENVLTRLTPTRYPSAAPKPLGTIADELRAFIGDDDAVVFWAYYGAYDWVALCNLMGGMLNLPKGWYWICRELRTELDRGGLVNCRDEGRADEHNALADARWIRQAFDRIDPVPSTVLPQAAGRGEAGAELT